MQVPEGHTEQQVLDAIEKTVRLLASRFAFGPYTCEDLEQETRLLAVQAVASGKFDPRRGTLAAFLFAHCRNRLINWRRDRLVRCDSPCPRCQRGDFCLEEGRPCEEFLLWKLRQDAKANIRLPFNIEHIRDRDEPSMRAASTAETDAEAQELRDLIDAELPVELRAAYLQMLEGAPVSTERRQLVREAVAQILEEAGVELEGYGVSV